MNNSKVRWEIWEGTDGTTCCVAETFRKHPWLIQGQILTDVFYVDDIINLGMIRYHEIMGFEPYKPMEK